MDTEDKKLEALAEQWVNIVFAQIEAKKQRAKVGNKSQKRESVRIVRFEGKEEKMLTR
jgi:ACT domain-containing protein